MTVSKDSFRFGGVDMLERFGIRAVSYDVLAPRLRPRRLVVPGRDGSYDFGARRYEDRLVRIECDSRAALSRQALRELAHLLSKKGQLILWDEPDKHYAGRLYDEAALRYIGRIGHEFTLTFVCEPFAVGQTVAEAVGGRAAYGGTATTPVRLTLTNNGTTAVTGIRMLVRRIV